MVDKMNEDYNLSKMFSEVYKEDKVFKSTESNLDFLFRLVDNNILFNRGGFIGSINKLFEKANSFNNERDYILHFLIMCECLLSKELPVLNRFNQAKFEELVENNIIAINYSDNKIHSCIVNNINLLEDEYFNIRYKVSNFVKINPSVNIFDSSVNTNVINSNIVGLY